MAQPTTAKFGKFVVMLGTVGAPLAPVSVSSMSNTNPAVATVGAGGIAAFANGQMVTFTGYTTDMVAANGSHQIANISGTGFELVGVDLSAAAAPQVAGMAQPPGNLITYAAPCGFTSKSFTLTKNLQEIDIPDCDDPDAVAWVGRDAQNLSAVITGDGVAAAESVPLWNDAWQAVDSVPAQIEIEFSSGVLTYTGYFQVDELAFTAEQAARVTLAVNMQSDGEVVDVWTPTP